MKKYSRILRKVCAIAVTILMTVSFVVTDRPDQVFAASTIKVTAVTMTYNDTQYDVYNNVTTISTDYPEEVDFDFQLNNTSRYSYLVEFYSEQEDGTQKLMWQDHNTTHASFNLYDLLPDSGIRMVVYEVSGWVTKKDDLMLGVLVEEGKNRKLFTSTVEIGPDKGATVDMSSLNEGMSFSMNPFPIPIVYKKFPDGRSVIGLGWNASNQGFWKQAEAGNFPTLSHGQLVKRWEDEHGTKEVSKFGLSWSVSGYATTFSDDPDKMTGTIQFYAGTGAEAAGQYLIFTYSITVTVGVDGSLVFSLKPKQEKDLDPLMLNEEQRKAGEDEFLTDFDLNATAGLELYGGIGIGCLLSAGIYGSATFVASMHMYPGFYMKEVYVDGEMGIKAKALGRTVLTFTFVKDRMDFYKRLEADGTEVYSSEINLRDEFVRQYNDLLSTDYGSKVYEVEEPEGKTIWESRTNLTDLSETEGGSLRTEDGMIVGDAGYAKKIASNVHPDAGIQVEKMNNNTDAVIALVANNAERSAGNKGELQYLLYSNSDKSYTVPKPVCRDINGDGREDTGADYDPRMKHNPENGKIYLVWKRGQDESSNKLTLTEAARINKLCFAEYDETNDRWIQQAILLDDPDILIGDAAIGYQYVDASDPCVYMYTNPADDPAGLSANSQHDILVFKKNSN